MAAFKVAKKEKLSKSQLDNFKSLLSLAKSSYEEIITQLLNVMEVGIPDGIKNKTQLFKSEIENNGDKHRLKTQVIADIVDRQQIRKLCQNNVST